MIETCRKIESKSRSIITEIDAENNGKLLDDISKIYSVKKITQKRIEKKLLTVTFWGIYSLHWKLIYSKKIMRFSIERVKRLEYMAAEMIFYYILNLSYIFQYSSWYYCSCNRFQGCQYRNGEEFYCFICWFQLEYNPRDIEKIFNTQKIAKIYLSMKKGFKKCIDFDPSISTF